MTPERYQQVKEVLQNALELPFTEQAAYLDQACAGDAAMRDEVETLLASHEQAPSFFEKPAGEMVAPFGLDAPNGEWEGKLIGPYRIKREIGRGGMGVVYLAVRDDDEYKKRVAIKLLKRGMDSADIIKRFRHERQTLAALDHSNIAKLLDGGTTEDGRPYFVMEYIEGRPIDEYCDAHQLNVVERIELFRIACSAVHYAHQNLVVHRDLKPSNILVTADGTLKLLDFGIAKLLNPEMSPEPITITKTEIRLMTPEYASPEQVRGEVITTASDVYSLGVLFYQLLTGHRPYHLTSHVRQDIERVICEVNPEKPSTAVSRIEEIPATNGKPATTLTPELVSKTREGTPDKLRRRLAGDVDNIVLMAMRKEPHRRYSSVEQFAEDLRRHLVGLPVIACKDTYAYRSSRFIKRHKIGVAVAAAFTILVLGFSITTKVQANRIAAQSKQIALERDKAQEVSKFLVELFKASDPSEAKGDTITAREILQRGVEKIEQLKDQPEVQATLMNTIGDVYRSLGLYPQALPLLERALARRKQIHGNEHPDVAATLHIMGVTLWEKGDYTASDSIHREALSIRRRLLGNNHPDVATSLNYLAVVLINKGQYNEAKSLLEEALVIRRQNFGKEHRDVAESINDLGVVYYSNGDLDTAISLIQEAIAIRRKLLGDKHPELYISLGNLATILHTKGDYGAAELLYREVLTMRRKLLGNEHQRVVTDLDNLAVLLFDKGDYEAAESLHHEAFLMRRKLLGDEHPDVVISLNNLASLFENKGEYDTAEAYYRQALAMWRKLLGNEHPNVALGLNNLAVLLHKMGKYEEAESLQREALAIRRKLLGNEHPHIAYSLNNLGALLNDKGDYEAAEQMHREALTIRRKLLGNEHVLVAASLNNLAASLEHKSDQDTVESLYREALTINRKLLGNEHPDVATSLNNLGAWLHDNGKNKDAEPLFRESLNIRRKTLPEDHWRTASTKSRLGGCLTGLRRFEEAESLLVESYPILKSERGEKDKHTQKALNYLIDLYKAWGKPEKATKYRAMLPKSETAQR